MNYELRKRTYTENPRGLRLAFQSNDAKGKSAKPPVGKSVTEPLTDKVLVERAKGGDSIAFSELVNRHYARAVRVAYGLLKDRHDAEDCVQEAFVRVHKRLKDFEGTSAFYTWLYRIVVNASIDQMRKRKRERRVDIEEESTREALRSSDDPWATYDHTQPETTVQRKQLGEQIQRALNELPEIHRAVILLRELEGLSYDEIAATLGIKKGTVMSRLFHARKAMQERMKVTSELGQHRAPGGVG